MLPYYSFLSCCALALLATQPARAQTTLPADTAKVTTTPATSSASSPELPWWLPHAKECAAIRAEESRNATLQAQRRKKQLRRWAEEQPEPTSNRP